MYTLGALLSPPGYGDTQLDDVYASLVMAENLPSVLDYREQMLRVRDQGEQGSCVAMAFAACKEWQERRDTNLSAVFAPQFIYDLRKNASSEGMSMYDALSILGKKGCALERDYPYGKKRALTPEVEAAAKNFVISDYAYIRDAETLKRSLFENGPCAIVVRVYNYGRRMWAKSGDDERIQGYHCMAVVGYNERGFILRNSWGVSWGDDGHTIFPYADWGMHSEVWTTVDARGSRKVPDDEKRDGGKKCGKCIIS